VAGFDSLRDYPRSEYDDSTVTRGGPEDVDVVAARFVLDPRSDSDRLVSRPHRSAYAPGMF
jgi:hypothetical protein